MHKPIISRIRSIVDGSLVHCHGRSEFESRHPTLCFFFSFFFSFLYFHDCKQCIPYSVDAFSGISHIRSVFDNVPFDRHFV